MRLIFTVCSEPKNNEFMIDHFAPKGFECVSLGMKTSMKNRTVSWRRIILYYKYIQVAIASIQKSKQDDLIIAQNFVIGAWTGFFCKLLGIKRTILSLNMISHDKGFINTIVRRVVYNTAFKYPYFYITVNSKGLIDVYSKEFKIHVDHFYLLHDAIREHYESAPFKPGDGSVFCGGEAMRDWNTLFNAAKLLPKVPFTAVARKIHFDLSLEIPENVTMYYDCEFDFFYQKLTESSVVAMPLTTTAPAGLTVMIKAALLSKPIIITATPSTKDYIEDNVNGILLEKGDEKRLAAEIIRILSDDTVAERLTTSMTKSIKAFSMENYFGTMENIVRQLVKV
ncbi:MAG: hypothetical protein JWR61_2720 [Ferruginibacter sp.]|uniref:glycosyltransferase n=1 Tax=Ferruginibacter sp. TaxID=1940288 RepID=UPI0026580450|nr:glycosyltransferase [Ferruginibacter sp.]MDB5277765.1 hypothetical protein [Ferruginibacter sp.]